MTKVKMTYKEWEHRVDLELELLCGMNSDMLPDWNSRDAYNDNMTPKRAAKKWLAHAKTF